MITGPYLNTEYLAFYLDSDARGLVGEQGYFTRMKDAANPPPLKDSIVFSMTMLGGGTRGQPPHRRPRRLAGGRRSRAGRL